MLILTGWDWPAYGKSCFEIGRDVGNLSSECRRVSCVVATHPLDPARRPLLRAINELGFKNPTPIQAAALPFALGGRDVCGSAVTGSGKTAAFMLPVLERLLYRRVTATTPHNHSQEGRRARRQGAGEERGLWYSSRLTPDVLRTGLAASQPHAW